MILRDLSADLKSLARNPRNVKDYSRFHKDSRKHIGLTSGIVRGLASRYYLQIKHLDKKEILGLCDKLLKARTNESTTIAFSWAYRLRKKFDRKDFKTFERWVQQYVDSWSTCDDLCCRALGYHVHAFPATLPTVMRWTKSTNMWKRRAAAVALIFSVRRGDHLDKAFEVAKALFNDEEDLVQKGYGWLLKEASKSERKKVFDFVMKNKVRMSRTALRYAIEKLPAGMRKKAMN